jgi:hypothetical protein
MRAHHHSGPSCFAYVGSRLSRCRTDSACSTRELVVPAYGTNTSGRENA